MKTTLLSAAVVLTFASIAFAGPGGQPPINGGPVAIVQNDIGSCNNDWAEGSFDKFYTLTTNKDGTYNLQVNYKKGTFVSFAGPSPGACASGVYNGSTIGDGVTGRMHHEYNATVTALNSALPDPTPDCGVNNVGCTGSGGFLNAVFGAGNWVRTDFSWQDHYEAGSNGTYFDTSVNWPLNNRGDITGSP